LTLMNAVVSASADVASTDATKIPVATVSIDLVIVF
jgi:hypothetical protein